MLRLLLIEDDPDRIACSAHGYWFSLIILQPVDR